MGVLQELLTHSYSKHLQNHKYFKYNTTGNHVWYGQMCEQTWPSVAASPVQLHSRDRQAQLMLSRKRIEMIYWGTRFIAIHEFMQIFMMFVPAVFLALMWTLLIAECEVHESRDSTLTCTIPVLLTVWILRLFLNLYICFFVLM